MHVLSLWLKELHLSALSYFKLTLLANDSEVWKMSVIYKTQISGQTQMGPTIIIIIIISNVSPKSNWTQAQQDGCRIRSSGGALLVLDATSGQTRPLSAGANSEEPAGAFAQLSQPWAVNRELPALGNCWGKVWDVKRSILIPNGMIPPLGRVKLILKVIIIISTAERCS